MKRNQHWIVFLLALIFHNPLYCEGRQYLCGSDEDGCYEYMSCACIPVDEMEYGKPYCLDFDRLTCAPLSQSPNCIAYFIFKNQGECLATIFQSEAVPPCGTVSYSFCVENHIAFCEGNGDLGSCKISR